MKFGPVVQKMSFKDISYLKVWQPLSSADRNHLCYFCRRHHKEQICKIILNLEQWFRRKWHLNLYLELWQPFCSADHNRLCSFCRGYYGKRFCEIILNLGQWFRRRCCLQDFNLELWQPSCLLEHNNLCNFERGPHGEHSCKVMKFGPVVQKMSFKDTSYLSLWPPLKVLFRGAKPLCNFCRRHHWEQIRESILNLDQWFRRKWHLNVFSYLELWQPFCLAERNYLRNFGRGYYEE